MQMAILDFMQQYLPASAVQILRLCVWLALLSVIFIPLERLFALHPQKIFRKGILIDVAYYFLSGVAPNLLLSMPLAVLAWGVHHVVPPTLTASIAAWPLWLRLVVGLVVADIGSYWGHRWSHEIPFLWRFHSIHHTAKEMDFLVNTRAHPLDMAFTRLCGLVPLYILGLAAPTGSSGSTIPLLVMLLGTCWGFFVHANLRWRFGPLERILATPAFHHWHHTNDGPAYVNKNYAATLPWVDALFGTLYLPKGKTPERYGINQATPVSLLGQLIQPFANEPSNIPARELQNIHDDLVVWTQSGECLGIQRDVCTSITEDFSSSTNSLNGSNKNASAILPVLVGTTMADRLPHRSVRAELPHTPPEGCTGEPI